MKVIRIGLSLIALVLIVGVIAISALLFFINPNKLKPVIAAELSKQTGYEAVIEGKFSWSFYPNLGVKVEHIALYIPKQPIPFVDMHDITFKTALSDLLKGEQKLDGDIYISRVKLFQVEAQNARVGLHWQNQVLTLQPLKADLYSGSLEGTAHGNDLTSTPKWDWDISLSNVQLQPLLRDVNGIDSKLSMSGEGDVKLQGGSLGKSRLDILNNLNGTVIFNLQNGVVDGIDLNYLIKTADALLNKQPVVAPDNITQTSFEHFAGTIIIKNGLATTNNLSLSSSAQNTVGVGSVNLPLNIINMQLRVSPLQTARTQWLIPVTITGNLYKPDVKLEMTELTTVVTKEKLEKVKNKVREEIKGHLSGKAGEALQNLLGK